MNPGVHYVSDNKAVTRAAEHSLRALGIARARPVRVEGGTGQWWADRDALARLDQEWVPRTTLLSPSGNLVCDRERTERLWGFAYRNEMYVPKAKRQYGYYVMPVLAGERLTGRAPAWSATRARGGSAYPERG
jgi:uncharacterized protein